MSGFGAPVAEGINGPAQNLPMLNNIMNLRLQQQQLQSGALGIAGQQAQLPAIQQEAKVKQQSAQQAQAFGKYVQSGVDDQGQSLMGANGEIDPTKLVMMAGRVAPLAPQIAQNVIKTVSDKVGLQSSMQTLDAQGQKLVQGPIQSLSLDPSNQNIESTRQRLTQLATDHPELGSIVNHAGTFLDHMENTADPKAREHLAQSLPALFQTGEQVQTQPQAGTIDTGTQIQPGVVQAPAAGGGFTPSGSPIQKGMMGINPATGQPFSVTPGTNPAPAPVQQAPNAAQPASQWPKLPQFPTPQQASSATTAAQEADTLRQADSNPVSGYAPTKQVYTNLLGLLKANPSIGPNSGAWNKLTSILTPFGASPNSNMQEVGSYLDRLALQNAGAAGLSTDAARSMAAGAAGTTEMNPQALAEKLRFGAATLEASHAYRQGLDNVVGTSNQNPIAKRAFDAEWAKNADINAFRLLAAKSEGDTEGYDQTLAKINKLPPNQRTQVQLHMHNLNMLVNGQMPQ